MLVLLALLALSTLHADPPNWSVNAPDYQYNMVGFIRVLTLNNTFLNEDSTMIRALVDDETRGVVIVDDLIFVGDEVYMPITMYSNQQVGEILHFEVYVASQDSIYTPAEIAIFNRNETLGTPAVPFLLTVGICNSILVLTTANVPFRSFYKAGTEIHLVGQIVDFSGTLALDAPFVKVAGNSLLDFDNTLIVKKDGCNFD
ncbi:MAG: hypothetical protein ACJATI_001905 [Halioglobus sp.]|jgi:hypothetical protein